MKKHSVKIGSLVFLGLPLVLLGGCATNASVGQMVYSYKGTQPPKSSGLLHNITMNTATTFKSSPKKG